MITIAIDVHNMTYVKIFNNSTKLYVFKYLFDWCELEREESQTIKIGGIKVIFCDICYMYAFVFNFTSIFGLDNAFF